MLFPSGEVNPRQLIPAKSMPNTSWCLCHGYTECRSPGTPASQTGRSLPSNTPFCRGSGREHPGRYIPCSFCSRPPQRQQIGPGFSETLIKPLKILSVTLSELLYAFPVEIVLQSLNALNEEASFVLCEHSATLLKVPESGRAGPCPVVLTASVHRAGVPDILKNFELRRVHRRRAVESVFLGEGEQLRICNDVLLLIKPVGTCQAGCMLPHIGSPLSCRSEFRWFYGVIIRYRCDKVKIIRQSCRTRDPHPLRKDSLPGDEDRSDSILRSVFIPALDRD